MKCPFCANLEDKVVDSRVSGEGSAIRRRRECLSCKKRFTTYEYVEEIPLMVVKKDGRRETFDRKKILNGLLKACEKRPVSIEKIEAIVDDIQRVIQSQYEKEVPSSAVGELLMRQLYQLDEIAYVRFASVYRQFKDVTHFMKELKNLLEQKK